VSLFFSHLQQFLHGFEWVSPLDKLLPLPVFLSLLQKYIDITETEKSSPKSHLKNKHHDSWGWVFLEGFVHSLVLNGTVSIWCFK